jgi:nucleotidyltransferase substrate binding protein (TIGR01987 family)
MKNQDIRWVQRFSNFIKAFSQLEKAVRLSEERDLSDLEEQGLIQSFEYTHELAWKTLKDFIQEKGNTKIYGSKDATREAFQLGLISDGEGWMEMIKSRNETSHTYNDDTAEAIASNIKEKYYNPLC